MADVFTEQDLVLFQDNGPDEGFTVEDLQVGLFQPRESIVFQQPESPKQAAQFATDRAKKRGRGPAEFRPNEQKLIADRIGEIEPVDPLLRAAFGATVRKDPQSAENILREEFGKDAQIVRLLDENFEPSNFYIVDKEGREFIWDKPDDAVGDVAEAAPDLVAGGISTAASALGAKAGPAGSLAAGAVADAVSGTAKQAFAESFGADEDLEISDRVGAVAAEVGTGLVLDQFGRMFGEAVDFARPTKILGRDIASSEGALGKKGKELAIEAFKEGGGALDKSMAQAVRTARAFDLQARIAADPKASRFFTDLETKQMQQMGDRMNALFASNKPIESVATEAALAYRGLVISAEKELRKSAKVAFDEVHDLAGSQAFIPTQPTVDKIDKLLPDFVADIESAESKAISRFLSRTKTNMTRGGRSASTSKQFQSNLSTLKAIAAGRDTIPGLKNRGKGQKLAIDLLDSMFDSSRLARGQPGVPVAALDKLDEAVVGYRAGKEKIESLKNALLQNTVKKSLRKKADDPIRPLLAIKEMSRDTTPSGEVASAINILENGGAHLEASNLRGAVVEDILHGVKSPADLINILDDPKSLKAEKIRAIMTPEQRKGVNKLLSQARLLATKDPRANQRISFFGEVKKVMPLAEYGRVEGMLLALARPKNLARIMTDPDKTKAFLGIIDPKLPRITGPAARFFTHNIEDRIRRLHDSLEGKQDEQRASP